MRFRCLVNCIIYPMLPHKFRFLLSAQLTWGKNAICLLWRIQPHMNPIIPSLELKISYKKWLMRIHKQQGLISIGRSAEGQDILHWSSRQDYGERKKRKKKREKLGRQIEKLGFLIQGAQYAHEVCESQSNHLMIINCITVDSDGHISLYNPCASGKHI